MSRTNLRFLSSAFVLASTAIFLWTQPRGEVLPLRLPLLDFPTKTEEWQSVDIPIAKDVLAVLGPGDFLFREYQNRKRSQPPADLFIAYFPSQRSGDTIHSPQNCLPGTGWIPIASETIMLKAAGHEAFPANRYVVAKGDLRQLVIYWYWAHDRGLASEYLAKFYLVADSIRMHRSDGALIRITTVMLPGESVSAAQQRVVPFADSVVPLLHRYIPS